jgi:hypothetical protein
VTTELILILVTLLCLSVVMVLAMVPFTMEIISQSKTTREHRRRLRKAGAYGLLTEKLLPRFFDQRSPLRLWGALYVATWVGLLAVFGALIADSEPKDVLKNVLVVALIVSAWWSIQLVVIVVFRAFNRLNDPSRQAELKVKAASADLPQSPVAPPAPVGAADVDGSTSRPSKMRGLWGWIMVAIAFLVIGTVNAVEEQYAQLRQIDDYFRQRQFLFLSIAIAMVVVGGLVFVWSVVSMVFAGGGPMSREEIEKLYAQKMLYGQSSAGHIVRYHISGEAAGAQAEETFSFTEMKFAWKAGLWRIDPVWRRRFLMLAGVLTLLFGLSGIAIVVAPLGIKLLVVGCLAYVVVRTVSGVRRAT